MTKYRIPTMNPVKAAVAEFETVGDQTFIRRHSGGRGPRTTWVEIDNKVYPANAIFRCALGPELSENNYNTSDSYDFAKALSLHIVKPEEVEATPWSEAIDDVDATTVGNDSPEYKRRMSGRYERDEAVRVAVLARADGHCEYRQCSSFKKPDGTTYLETHHVISLSEQGRDRVDNVIALCANHHRQAHCGADWEQLQQEFSDILKRLCG